MPIQKRVTITEIARLCGVSAQTVSRVINDRPDVAATTRASVEKAIANAGYHPSALARGLVRQHSLVLGVVVSGLREVGVSQILNGIAERSQAAGYALLLHEVADTDRSSLEPVVRMLRSHQAEGIVFATPSTDWAVGLADRIPRSCPPALFLKQGPSAHHTTIRIDNKLGARTAIEHLLALGRRAIAHVSGPEPWLETAHRRIGWQETLSSAGLRADRLGEGNWSAASGQSAFGRMLDRYPDIDGVFVGNDQMALGVMREAARRGMRIPDDLAVVGFDGLTESALYTPSLTTIVHPLVAMGALAVDRLLGEIDGADAHPGADIVLPTQLIVRESAPLAV